MNIWMLKNVEDYNYRNIFLYLKYRYFLLLIEINYLVRRIYIFISRQNIIYKEVEVRSSFREENKSFSVIGVV